MNKMSDSQKHQQILREVKWTLLLTVICAAWHSITAFALNGTGWYFLGMPAWFSVSVFGTIVIAIVGVFLLVKKVFVDFDYDEEAGEENEQ